MGELVFGLQNPRNYLNPSPNLRPSQNDVPNMQIKVNEGKCWIGQSMVTVFTSLSPAFSAPPSGTVKIDVLGVSGPSGNLTIVPGTAVPLMTPPEVPALPSKDFYPICLVLLQGGTTAITNNNLIDVRELANFGQASSWAHNDLGGRSAADAHPISAITNLSAELSNRPTTSTINAALAAKADQDGTNSEVFTLNKDETGAPTQNGRYKVRRGILPDVELRWNETTDKWEFTNDGTTFVPIAGTGSGSIGTINGISPSGSGNFSVGPKVGSFVNVAPQTNGITKRDGAKAPAFRHGDEAPPLPS